MSPLGAIAFVVAGLALVLYFAGKLVAGAIGTARGLGVSAFVVSVIFIGFDPENLGVGAVAAHEGVAGIALGSVIGAAMVAIALALGITALLVPLRFEQASARILSLPVLAVLLFGGLSLDGELSRSDGAVLLLAYGAAVAWILRLSAKGMGVEPAGDEEMEQAGALGKWKAFGLLLLALAGIVVGSEMIVAGSATIIEHLGISDTVYGMTILALLVSIEEVARELPAALRGRPEISLGNVIGSVLAFFLLNAGIIALVKPFPVEQPVLAFHLPWVLVTTTVVSGIAVRRTIPRWAGLVLVLLYIGFVAGSYVIRRGPGALPGS
jgi:cation:H+ antiporter